MVSCGAPCTLHFLVLNLSKQRREIGLLVNPVACMPYASTGPCWKPIGVVEADDGYVALRLPYFRYCLAAGRLQGCLKFEMRERRTRCCTR